MKITSPALGLAVAISLAVSIAKAPAIEIQKANGTMINVPAVTGTVVRVDQSRRSFTIQYQHQGKSNLPMEHRYVSVEWTFSVTDGTVYKNGSWADLKPGAHVVVTGHSTVADTVQFGGGGAQQSGSAENATAINRRGLAKAAKGDWSGAMADYNEAIKLDPKYSAAYDNRGEAKRRGGDLSGALADIDQAISLNPKNSIAYFNRAKVKEAKGDLDGAVADYSQAISLNPKYAAAYKGRGLIRRKKGDMSGAQADLSKAAAPSILTQSQ